jgi:four helix bundle protein
MKSSNIRDKSFVFSIRIVNLYKYLVDKKKEFVLSKQLLRSGTAVGALVREAEFGESKKDFIHKFSIAQKEINETIYWLELLYHTGFIAEKEFSSINIDAIELIKIITAIIKNSKRNIITNN